MILRRRIIWRTLIWVAGSLAVMGGGILLLWRIEIHSVGDELGWILRCTWAVMFCMASQVVHVPTWTWIWSLTPPQIDILIEDLKEIKAIKLLQDEKDPLKQELAKRKQRKSA